MPESEAPVSRRIWTRFKGLLFDVADVLKFGFRYPPLFLLAGFVLLLACGQAMTGFDGPHVLWDEEPWHGIAAGFGAGALFALFFHFYDVLHARGDSAEGGKHTKPVASHAFRLWCMLLAMLAVLPQVTIHGFADPYTWDGLKPRLWFPIGLFLAFLLVQFTRSPVADEPPKVDGSGDTSINKPVIETADSRIEKKRNWFGRRRDDFLWCLSETWNMHRGGTWLASMTAVFALFAFLYTVVRTGWWKGQALFGGGFVVLMALFFLCGVLGLAYYLAVRSGRRHVINYAIGFFALGAYLFTLIFQLCWPYTYFEVEHLAPNVRKKDGTSYYDEPSAWKKTEYLGLKPASHQLKDQAVLENWKARIDSLYTAEDSYTPLNIVTVSGGASTSALYVAEALYRLEMRDPGFIDKTRLVSGASGGMLGAAYFVSRLHPHPDRPDDRFVALRKAYLEARGKWRTRTLSDEDFKAATAAYRKGLEDHHDEYIAPLKADFLSPLLQAWFAKDFPEAFRAPLVACSWAILGWPFPTTTEVDRGTALEEAWCRRMPSLGVPFATFSPTEGRGELPSMVFSPMSVEDGRQVLISNLDLNYMTRTPETSDADSDTTFTALEFYRLFPEAADFRLCTAVRLQASFPFFSPPAYLPTNPSRRVVDAGYYDNYGLIVACRWLEKNRPWLVANRVTPRLFHIWSYGYGRDGSRLQTQEEFEKGEKDNARWKLRGERGKTEKVPVVNIHPGFTTFSGPLGGLMSSWRSNMAYRGEERLNDIMGAFAAEGGKGLPARRYKLDMLENAAGAEAMTEMPMNWYLSPRNIEMILKRAGKVVDGLDKEFEKLQETVQADSRDPKSKELIQAAVNKLAPDLKGRKPSTQAAEALWDLRLETKQMMDAKAIPKMVNAKPVPKDAKAAPP